jgi:hypothetical protein
VSGRDDLVGGVIGGLTATDRARLLRGITIGALVGAAIAGSLLRTRRRRPPRPVLRLGPTVEREVSDPEDGAPEPEAAPETEGDGHIEAPAGTE